MHTPIPNGVTSYNRPANPNIDRRVLTIINCSFLDVGVRATSARIALLPISVSSCHSSEQLQQQRQEVSQRVTQDGTWHRQTDQKIIEKSMHREVKTDTENRTVIARETTVQATDKTTVIGTSTLMAGAIMQIAVGDFSQATQANRVIAVGQQLEEKIGAVRSSIAGAMQKIMAPVVYLGNEQLNVMQCMLDTLDVVNELATLTANHTHNNTGNPLNASAISNTGTKSTGLKQKYSPVIG
ncbi:TPA: hypothetical protein OT776_002141 [Proteus mirabilis]|nr:hypothetical protein [Proteus mirabilis]